MENEWPGSEAVKPQRRRREQTRLSAKDLRAGPGARGSADPALDLADEQPALTVRAGPCRAGFPLLSAPLLPRDGTLRSESEIRGTLRFLPQLEMRPSSNAPSPVESREAPPTSSFPGFSEPP